MNIFRSNRQIKLGISAVFIGLTLLLTFNNCAQQFELASEVLPGDGLLDSASFEPPKIIFATSPELTNSNSITIAFSIELPASVQVASVLCQVNADAPQNCSSGMIVITNLPDGDHSLKVNARSSTGVSSEQIKMFRKDTTPPLIQVTQMPAVLTASTNAQFVFNATDALSGVNSIECSVDNTAFTSCASPFSRNVAAGPHTFKIRVTDRAGNSSAEYSYAWTIDNSVPSITLNPLASNFTNSRTMSLSFTGLNVTSFQCQIDGGAFETCTSPRNYSALPDGLHTFSVRGVNALGVPTAAQTASWTVDNVAPQLPVISSGVMAITKLKTAAFNFSSTDTLSGIARFECALDATAFSLCTSPVNLTNIPEGTHVFRVQSIDRAGNTSVVAMFSWSVDSVIPSVVLTQAPAAMTTSTSAVFNFTATDAAPSSGLIVECSLDNAAFTTCTSPRSLMVTVGTHNFAIRATDNAGNVQAQTHNWTVTAPVVIDGRSLYTSNCAGCHSAIENSNLNGRPMSAAIITGAFTKISSMNSLIGKLNDEQVTAIASLFTANGGGGVIAQNSDFKCDTPTAEKSTSILTRRLSAVELRNTYSAILSASVFSGLADSIGLLPSATPFGTGGQFNIPFSESNIDRISQFNEKVANLVIANNANIAAFFGTCATTASFTQACFNTFITARGPQILRSPITAADSTQFWTVSNQGTTVPAKLSILIQSLLNNPRFLYHVELGEGNADADGNISLSSHEIANRISYGMTASPPDSLLNAEIQKNSLKNIAVVSAQVDRIALLPAFKSQVREFAKFYVNRSAASVPISNASFLNGININGIDTAVNEEFDEFINHIVFTQRGTLKDLFTSKATFPKTAALATIYGTGVWTTGAAPMIAPNHTGILSKAFLNMSGSLNNRLVQRGRSMRLSMLCFEVPEPSASDLSERTILTEQEVINLSRRDYIDKATLIAPNCIACHSKMNQLGFATGNYDSLNRFITSERIFNANGVQVAQHNVVASTKPEFTSNDTRTFQDLNDFSTSFAETNAMQKCFATKTFQFFQWKPENVAQDSCRLNKIDTAIKQNVPLIQIFTENFKQQSMLYKRGAL